MINHEYFIRRTFLLAKKGEGKVAPNPMVGAILVKEGKVLGEGYHKRFTGLHAEVEAINNAVKKFGHKMLEGSTLYISLEPCCHFGNNPACTDIIISYGLKQVVFSCEDPNPLVAGKGKKILKDFGIKVISGVLKKEGEQLNEIFFKYIKKKIPFVYLKTALSLDGRITHPHKKYLSNKAALHFGHYMRNKIDAILVGHNTFIHDKPKLTCRIPGGHNPKKIILPARKVDLKALLKNLGKEGITSVMVEGGSQISTSFLQEKLVDKILLLYTPEIYGRMQLPFCQKLSKIAKLKDVKVEKLGNNILVEGYVIK
ncbi:MAG: bifunctional diaminohydroxyphosphoribosylaminopyrimidine deaminase/5-amino-6-(5-phosphoribosylamino)uracil reductase RibD [Patescibacteria group bacterium]|jgi:diaminohydroxyphosphoribosylaminopyrimidine deaminase/5-amino-6-(5-phosphoribosylamino)uracil reductase